MSDTERAFVAHHLRRQWIAVGLVIFAVGVLPVAVDLSRPAGLYGLTQYDDGVYFASALRLVAGIFPYRDFVLVQPPGITELLAPFAAFSHVVGERAAVAAARITTALVEGLNCVLIVWLLRKRGLLVASFGGLLLGIFPPAYSADHTFLLEPYLDLFCLVGIALVFSGNVPASFRSVVAGGIAFGFALAIKTFAIVPIIVLGVFLLATRRKLAGAFAVGIVAAIAVFVLPFFIASPHGFIHDVISSQISRTTQRPTPLVNRVYALVGLSYASASHALSLPAANRLVWTVGAIIAFLLVVGGVLPLLRGRSAPFVVFVQVCAVLVAIAMTFVPAVYYDHYALFSAPFLVLALADVAGRLSSVVRSFTARLSQSLHLALTKMITAGSVIACVLGAVIVLASSISYDVGGRVDKFGDPGPAIEATVPEGQCVVSDAASLLVVGDRAAPGPKGCPAVVDSTGTWLSIDPLNPPENSNAEPKDPRIVAFWRTTLAQTDYVVLSGICAFRIPWTTSLYTYFDTHFHRVPGPYGLVFQRGAAATAADQPDLAGRCATARATRTRS